MSEPQAFPLSVVKIVSLNQNEKTEEISSSKPSPAENPESKDQNFSEENVLEPKKKNTNQMRYQCFMCDYKTYHKSVFDEHIRVHKGIKPYKCTYCDYRSSSKKNAKNHEAVHRPDNPMKCKQCTFYARNLPNLRKHTRDYHERKTAFENCILCDVEYKHSRHKSYHEKQWVQCKKCVFVACGPMKLKSHMVACHEIKVKSTVRSTVFKCDVCQWESSNKTKVLLHLIHHPGQKVDESVLDLTILRKYNIIT